MSDMHNEVMRRLGRPNVPDLQAALAEAHAEIERLRVAASYPAMAADLHSVRLCCMEHGWDSVGDPAVWLTQRLSALQRERDEARTLLERLCDRGTLHALKDANDRAERAERNLARAAEVER